MIGGAGGRGVRTHQVILWRNAPTPRGQTGRARAAWPPENERSEAPL